MGGLRHHHPDHQQQQAPLHGDCQGVTGGAPPLPLLRTSPPSHTGAPPGWWGAGDAALLLGPGSSCMCDSAILPPSNAKAKAWLCYGWGGEWARGGQGR